MDQMDSLINGRLFWENNVGFQKDSFYFLKKERHLTLCCVNLSYLLVKKKHDTMSEIMIWNV